MNKNFSHKIDKARQLISDADYILIGAGAGLSAAAGFEYGGDFFMENFRDFYDKYGFTDMYSGGFCDFATIGEKWAYWSRFIYLNRYKYGAKPLYKNLLKMLVDKNYFIITTNVDHQFQLAGFDKERLFYTQGDYGLFQCSTPCHNKTYDNEQIIKQMVISQQNMTVPEHLIPRCPVCGKYMDVNLRKDFTFVEDEGWLKHAEKYNDFIIKAKNKNLVLIELGVGFNTPSIIRYPFESLVYNNQNVHLIRVNKNYAVCPPQITDNSLLFDDIQNFITALKNP